MRIHVVAMAVAAALVALCFLAFTMTGARAGCRTMFDVERDAHLLGLDLVAFLDSPADLAWLQVYGAPSGLLAGGAAVDAWRNLAGGEVVLIVYDASGCQIGGATASLPWWSSVVGHIAGGAA